MCRHTDLSHNAVCLRERKKENLMRGKWTRGTQISQGDYWEREITGTYHMDGGIERGW